MLLIDALELDYQRHGFEVNRPLVCMEIGSGSGAVLTTLSKFCQKISSNQSHLMIATDINHRACKTTRKCANYFKQDHIQVIQTNMAESLVDTLEGFVDILLFNPPYVPTEDPEVSDKFLGENQINLSWAGGSGDGRRLIDMFLMDYTPRLLSDGGAAYMIALDKNKISNLSSSLESKYQIVGQTLIERSSQLERLAVIKYQRRKRM